MKPLKQTAETSVAPAEAVNQAENLSLIVDSLIGYRLQGATQGAVADLIRWTNAEAAPVLTLDVPSGVDTCAGYFG